MDFSQTTLSHIQMLTKQSVPSLFGKKIFIQNIEDQFRFPKSKKKRIRKKFTKNPANFKPSTKIRATRDAVYMSQAIYDAIKNKTE